MEQIIVCISSVVTSEEPFLKKCGRSDEELWIYASTNGVVFALNSLCDNFNFVLINPEYVFTREVEPVTNSLKGKTGIAVWIHTGDNIKPADIKKKTKIAFIKSNNFRHGQNTAIENFMKNISV